MSNEIPDPRPLSERLRAEGHEALALDAEGLEAAAAQGDVFVEESHQWQERFEAAERRYHEANDRATRAESLLTEVHAAVRNVHGVRPGDPLATVQAAFAARLGADWRVSDNEPDADPHDDMVPLITRAELHPDEEPRKITGATIRTSDGIPRRELGPDGFRIVAGRNPDGTLAPGQTAEEVEAAAPGHLPDGAVTAARWDGTRWVPEGETPA